MPDPATMYLAFQGIAGMHRTVSLTSVSKANNADPVITDKAIRGKVAFRILQQTNGALVRPETMYSVPLALAPGPWKPGDLLIDSTQPDATAEDGTGITYKIQVAEADEGFWNLACFCPKTAWQLKDLVTILAIVEGRTGARTRTITTTNRLVNVPCRIQPTSSMWSVSHGKVGDQRTFDVFLDLDDFPYSPSAHLVQWYDQDTRQQVQADIRDVTLRQRLDELTRLTVELRVGP